MKATIVNSFRIEYLVSLLEKMLEKTMYKLHLPWVAIGIGISKVLKFMYFKYKRKPRRVA